MAARLGVAESPNALASNAAAEFLKLGADAIAQHGAFRVALAGGETPRATYEQIAATWRDAPGGSMAWDRVHVYWSDERMVPHDDPRSNCGMARAALLSQVPVPMENTHPIGSDAGKPEAAADNYEKTLRETFPHDTGPLPRFDLILLGMGADGHTASLFPGSISLNEHSKLAVAARHPDTNEPRVTLTLPVINHATTVIVLVSGSGKSVMLERAVRSAGRRPSGPLLPVEMVHPKTGTLLWMADSDAAPWARS